jgi:hypothetical protein
MVIADFFFSITGFFSLSNAAMILTAIVIDSSFSQTAGHNHARAGNGKKEIPFPAELSGQLKRNGVLTCAL